MSLATRNIVRAADEWKCDAMAMQTPPPSTDPTLDNLGRAPFGLMDILRRAEGDAFGAFGTRPERVPLSGNRTRIIEYPGEVGVCLQHLSMLVGRRARAQVWPQIISWLRSQS